jgi:hypothetical protein
MATAEELLNDVIEDDVVVEDGWSGEADNPAGTRPVAGERLIIIGSDRYITVPDCLKRIAVQFDHNTETVTFECPRYWDGRDLSVMKVYINYMRADGKLGSYTAEDVRVKGQDVSRIHFDWTITRNVTEVQGPISFLVCAKDVDSEGNEKTHWNSELNRDCTVSEGLECEHTILEHYPDIITQILTRLDSVGSGGGSSVNIVSVEVEGEDLKHNDIYNAVTIRELIIGLNDELISSLNILEEQIESKQDNDKLVLSVDVLSDNDTYPSTRAVYDYGMYILQKHRDMMIDNIPTNPSSLQYPSAKAVADYCQYMTDLHAANMVNNISSNPSPSHYPSVIAVKNYVTEVIGGIENGSY